MTAEGTAAFGIFSDRITTENAIETLRAAGFRTTDIFAMFPDDLPTKRLPPNTRKKLVTGVAAGGSVGIAVGGVLEWLAGAGILSTGGLAALGFIGLGGSFVGVWASRRTTDYEKRYEGRVRRGDILISVRCDDLHWAKKAREILKRAGGDDVSSTTKVAADLGIPHRPVIRPVNEKTVAPAVLRLVANRPNERLGADAIAPERKPTEIHSKSVAS